MNVYRGRIGCSSSDSHRTVGDSIQPLTVITQRVPPMPIILFVNPINPLSFHYSLPFFLLCTCNGEVLWSVWKLPCDTFERSFTILQTITN